MITVKKKKVVRMIVIPPKKLTYPTLGRGKSSSNMPYQGDMMLIPWMVICSFFQHTELEAPPRLVDSKDTEVVMSSPVYKAQPIYKSKYI